MLPIIIAYILLVILIITLFINKSKLLSFYFISISLCDIAGLIRQQTTNYPKPYQGTGFLLFAITTCLYLAIPMLTALYTIHSFTKKINSLPFLCWLTACIGLLWAYPELRGQSMLDAFYAYYIVGGAATLAYFLLQVKKKFSFTQGGLFLSTLGSIVTTLIAIKEVSMLQMDHWILIVVCNCTFYLGLIVGSWINRYLNHLLP